MPRIVSIAGEKQVVHTACGATIAYLVSEVKDVSMNPNNPNNKTLVVYCPNCGQKITGAGISRT